ncbi:MAG: hypothetical protein KF809_16635 [Chloroflexi bacterium]|nr:hypothetical protein [Chloroflexota bacterium]
MRVPGFLARQVYVAGSLANEPGGFRLQARNGIGDGVLVGVGLIRVDDQAIDPRQISAQRDGEDTVYRAIDISPERPVTFRRGDVVTFHVAGWQLEPGEHDLEVELDERNLGRLTVAVRDALGG